MKIDEALSSLDLSQYPVDEVKKIISSLIGLGVLSRPISIGSTIQRISSFDDDVVNSIDSVEKLSYNPKAPKYGRANIPGVPMFYGCLDIPNDNKTTNEMIVAMFEGRAVKNGISIFSKWRVKKTLRVGCIIHPTIFPGTHNRFLLELKRQYCLFVRQYKNPLIDNIWKQVCEQFSKKHPDGKDYNYLFTAHLTHTLLEKSHFDGIIYPPVQTDGNVCMNVALTKEAVDNKISFDEARKAVIREEGVNKYHSSPIQGGVLVGEKLIWYDLPVAQ